MAMPDLLGILYLSGAQLDFDASQLSQLTELARKKNSEVGITGFLYYQGQHFLQYLEGEPNRIRKLVDIIAADGRHSVSFTHPLSISQRKFPSWHMRHVDSAQAQSVRVENLLIEILELMKNPQVMNADYKEKLILRMLDRLAVNQEKLSFS